VIPLFHAAWLFALGIALSHTTWLRPSIVLVALAPVALLCILAAFCAQPIRWLSLAALWCLLGVWCAEMEPLPGPSRDILTLSDGLLRTVDGTVLDAAPLRTEQVDNLGEAGNESPSQRIDLQVANIEVVNDIEDRQVPAGGACD
jgi:competence protein ComEC